MISFKFLSDNQPNRALLPNEQFIAYQRGDGGYVGRVIAWRERLPYVDWITSNFTGTMDDFFEDRLEIPQVKQIVVDGINYDRELLENNDIMRGAVVEITYFKPL